MKRYLRGFKKRYFKLSLIAVYSGIKKLLCIDTNYIYHKFLFKEPKRQTSPPKNDFAIKIF